mgnify:CR=1 FL=1
MIDLKKVVIKEKKVDTILTKSNLPIAGYSINPYVGCPFGCEYCYATFMKRFTGHKEDWGMFLDVKMWDKIKNPEKYKGKTMIVGSVTDGYNYFEAKYKRTRAFLEEMQGSGINLIITTKSNLVTRDIDLIKTYPNPLVAWSINTLDEEFKKEREQTKSFEEAFNKLKQDGLIEGKGHNSPYNRVTEGRFKILRAAIKANEDPFEKNNIPLQYNDEYSHLNSNQLLDKMRWHLERGEIDEAQKYYNVLHKRILQNKYIRNHGNPQAFLERPYSNLSDEQLKLQYEMAKKANNKEEMRKYEEEMELRNKAKGQVPQQIVTNQNTNENMNNTDENNTETNPENEEKQTKKNEYKDRGTLDRFRRGTISGVKALGKKAIKPVWNFDKTAGENVQELLTDKVLKGAVQATVGVTTAAVQAGVSLTDGKYTAKEAIGSLAGGIALGGKVYKSGKKFAKGVAREVNYGSSDDERKNRIAKDWSERDDVQDEFKNTYGAKSDEMIRRAKHIVVKSAIQDVNEQKKIFRYSNYLRKHNSSYSIEEADKKALEVYKYKNSLESRNQLDRVINDKSAREEIAERAVQNNRSSKSSDLVRKNCLDMIESAVEFNNVQENSELDIFGGE